MKVQTAPMTKTSLPYMSANTVFWVLSLCCVALLSRPAQSAPNLHAAVLPTSRSVQLGTPATFFATIINDGNERAENCRIEMSAIAASDFQYQITAPTTNALRGAPNVPIDLNAGAAQTFVLSINSGAPLSPMKFSPVFVCDNVPPALSLPQVNTLDLSVTNEPVPDIIAFASTGTANGRLEMLTDETTEAFVVAVANLGVLAQIDVSASLSNANLPLELSWCETDAATSQCVDEPISSGSFPLTIESGGTSTLAVFVQSNGRVPFQPQTSRITVSLTEGSITRSRVSVAPYTNTLAQRPDPSFGVRGLVTPLTGRSEGQEQSTDMLMQPDGKLIVIGGYNSRVGGNSFPEPTIQRFHPDGSRDTSFAAELTVSRARFTRVGLQADGKLLLARQFLTRLNQDGSLDSEFGTDGTVVLAEHDRFSSIVSAAQLTNGDIFAVGQANPLAPKIWHISPTGELLEEITDLFPAERFGVFGTKLETISALPDGKMLIAGQAQFDRVQLPGGSSYYESYPLMLIRLLANGDLDEDFGDRGFVFIGANDRISNVFEALLFRDFHVFPDGSSALVGSEFSLSGGLLARVTAEGLLDETFGDRGVVFFDRDNGCVRRPTALSGTSDGELFVGGVRFRARDQAPTGGILRFNASGEVVAGFGTGGCLLSPDTAINPTGDVPTALLVTPSTELLVLFNGDYQLGSPYRSWLTKFTTFVGDE